MPQKINQQQSARQAIVCPVCNGSGKKGIGLACPNCAGMGVGIFYEDTFFYWGPQIGVAYIELSRVRRLAHIAINTISFAVGLSGLLAFGVWIWRNSDAVRGAEILAFWKVKDSLLLIFWAGLIGAMFAMYRLSEEALQKHKIIRQKRYRIGKQKENLPNNWSELKRMKSRFKIDVSAGYSERAMKVVEEAYLLTQKAGHRDMETMHLFLSSLHDKQVAALFSRLNVDGDKLVDKIKKQIEKFEINEDRVGISSAAKEVLIEAYFDARAMGQKAVKPVNFLLPLITKDKVFKEILYDLEVEHDKIFNVIIWFRINERLLEGYKHYKKMARFKPSSTMDRAYTAVATPALNQFAYDLTIAAKWGRLEYCVARESEIEEIFSHLEGGHNAVILVGLVGVGKGAVIDGIAQLMVEEDVPEILADKRLVELDVARLVSGATPAQAEERLLISIDEVARAGNIVLYIENIENLIGITAGTEESLDLSEVLVNALERKNIYCLAAATSRNYAKYIEGKSLGNAMTKVDIEEPTGNQAIQIVESKIGAMEGKYKVYFSYNALERVIALSEKYIHDKYLPQKAIEILESVAVRVAKNKGESSLVTKDDIAEVIGDITKIPISKITESEGEALLRLESRIHERMVNQEEAVKMVSASLRRARAELREGKRPIANFLFLGPTGVGKTELAKTVAEVYFGDEDYMIRLDMSEYQHADSIEKMIGDPDGTLGYLTEAVRKAPFSLVLLDEFEKAHPDILNLFLQVMDDGRLTDGQGRTIDFTNSIIIATSNAGAHFIQKKVFAGVRLEDIKQTLINDHLTKAMRPELINRFDGVIIFEPLSRENIVAIAGLMLAKTGNMLKAKGMGFRAVSEGVRKLAEEGFDPQFGARPMRRLIQKKIENTIADKILEGKLKRRDTVVINEEAEVGVEKGVEL